MRVIFWVLSWVLRFISILVFLDVLLILIFALSSFNIALIILSVWAFWVTIPVRIEKRWVAYLKPLLSIVLIVVSTQMMPIVLAESTTHLDRIDTQYKNKMMPMAWTDKVSLYSFGLIVATHSALFCKEVAWQYLLLYWPGQKVRTLHSDFAMQIPDIQRWLMDAVKTLNKKNAHQTVFNLLDKNITTQEIAHMPTKFQWLINRASIHAHAFNNTTQNEWQIEARLVSAVGDLRSQRVSLIKAGTETLSFDPHIFKSLIAEGWLFDYTAEWLWRFSVPRQ